MNRVKKVSRLHREAHAGHYAQVDERNRLVLAARAVVRFMAGGR